LAANQNGKQMADRQTRCHSDKQTDRQRVRQTDKQTGKRIFIDTKQLNKKSVFIEFGKYCIKFLRDFFLMKMDENDFFGSVSFKTKSALF
jgi:hypothetical protein